MLTVSSLSKSYGIEPILIDVSFTLNPGERLGLVGPNGSGKTTLLRILAGEEKPDSGSYRYSSPNPRLGYLPQGMAPDESDTIGGFLDRMAGNMDALGARLEQLAAALGESPDNLVELQHAYDETLSRLETAAQTQGEAAGVIAALGLTDFPPETPVTILSGGQKTRLALAGVLLSAPQVLLLDEPTNHLDIGMLEWLEDWLSNSSLTREMAILIVSHDRLFLDRTISGILDLDAATHQMKFYPGSYSDYVEQKLAERERHWQEYSDQNEEIARLRNAAETVRGMAAFKKGGKGDSGDKFAKGFFANRTKATVAKAKHLERRLEHLLTDERIEKPRQSWQMKLDFGAAPASGRDVIVMEDLAVGYGEQALLSGMNLALRYGQRVALIGANGAGKTTLVRTLAGKLPVVSGRVRLGSGVKIGYMAQEQETLEMKTDALETIRSLAPLGETEARAFLHQFLFGGDDVFTPVEKLSYGERARLMLACLVVGGSNLLLLDEPINHLDVPSRARFEQALQAFDGTVVAVVHDRYFIHTFASQIWEVAEGELRVMYRS